MNVNQAHQYPHLMTEVEASREAVLSAEPVLAIFWR